MTTQSHALQRMCRRVSASTCRLSLRLQRKRIRASSAPGTELGVIGCIRAQMKTAFLVFSYVLSASPGLAMPPAHTVTRQRAVIEGIQKGDRKAGKSERIDVRCLDSNSKRTKQVYWISFSDPTAIKALSRSRGARTITVDELRVGQELLFSGTANGPIIIPSRCTIYLP